MKRLFLSLVSFFFVLATFFTISYAWFINSEFQEPDISGYSYAAYFASGDGTKEKPYTITNKRHLYNLAWLQYLGNWNHYEISGENKTVTQQFYFQISSTVDELDMTGYILPPIGTKENPFIGVFNGNGCIINNLTISNDIYEFDEKYPKADSVNQDNIKNLNIIGMFGIVGNYNSMYKDFSFVPSVTNFYLDNISISSIAENTLIGLLAGYVAPSGNITNVGIHYSSFKLSNTVNHLSGNDFLSKYSLIGDYDSENIGWEDKPSSGSGDDAGFGGSLDVKNIYDRLKKIYKNDFNQYILSNNSKLSSDYRTYKLPFVKGTWDSTSNDFKVDTSIELVTKNWNGAGDNKGFMPFSVIESESDYDATTSDWVAAEKVKSNNVGFVVGNDTKIRRVDKEDLGLVDQNNFYSPTHDKNLISQKIVTNTIPDNIKNALGTTTNDGKFTFNEYYYTIQIQKGIDQNDITKIDYGNIGKADASLDNPFIAPQNCVWFKAIATGQASLVFCSGSTSANGTYSIYELNRTDSDLTKSWSKGNNLVDANEKSVIPGYIFYQTFNIEAGKEYAICNEDGATSYIMYLDIGTNAGSGGGETPTYSGSLSSIDFVYKLSNNSFSTISKETRSNVILTVKITTVTVNNIYFKRKVDSELNAVLYYIASTGYEITNIGTGNAQLASDSNCDSIQTS